MKFLKKLFGTKTYENTPEGFWEWFSDHAKSFHNSIVDTEDSHVEDVVSQIKSKLNLIQEGFFPIIGIKKNGTIELTISVNGDIRNVVFAEQLIEKSPTLPKWQFLALRQDQDNSDFTLEMNGFSFSEDTLFFYATADEVFSEEIAITFLHEEFRKDWQHLIFPELITFLHHYLGELECILTFDRIDTLNKNEAKETPIPLNKLKEYLKWRVNELDPKIQEQVYVPDDSNIQLLQGSLQNGLPIDALINMNVQNWTYKPAYPYAIVVSLLYNGNKEGMPFKEDETLLNEYELAVSQKLKDSSQYIKLGRQTLANTRHLFFFGKEFRQASASIDEIRRSYRFKLKSTYEIYRDKYWRSVEGFAVKEQD